MLCRRKSNKVIFDKAIASDAYLGSKQVSKHMYAALNVLRFGLPLMLSERCVSRLSLATLLSLLGLRSVLLQLEE